MSPNNKDGSEYGGLTPHYDDGFEYPSWDAKYKRPIVDGKVTNPFTGAIEIAGPMLMSGPPALDLLFINVKGTGPRHWSTVHASSGGTIGKAVCEVAEHVKQGFYKLMSLNATEFNLVVVWQSGMTSEEFGKVTRAMKKKLGTTGEIEPPYSMTAEKPVVVKESSG
ncbi:hypothetical protein VTL71DRAFT_7040 [Oculimacula yallundae]|uniref:Uncharacterized protein n=1 Tax=Oculimacula yallundae TaxID=86028 RepID=A0ABR4BVK2_9HELO